MNREPHETLRNVEVESPEVSSGSPRIDGKITASQPDPQAELRRQYVKALRAAARKLAKVLASGVPVWEAGKHASMDFAPFADLRCGARTRSGSPCRRKDLYRSGRCRLHGGMSTGPRTECGKARSASNGQAKPMKGVG